MQRLNHELQNHGKSTASALHNVSTSDDSSYKTAFWIAAIISGVLVVACFGLLIKQNCTSKNEDDFDPEMAEKRKPELNPEISLKAVEVPDLASKDTESQTIYEGMWAESGENTTRLDDTNLPIRE